MVNIFGLVKMQIKQDNYILSSFSTVIVLEGKFQNFTISNRRSR